MTLNEEQPTMAQDFTTAAEFRNSLGSNQVIYNLFQKEDPYSGVDGQGFTGGDYQEQTQNHFNT